MSSRLWCCCLVMGALGAGNAWSAGSMGHSAQALDHSGQALGEGMAASVSAGGQLSAAVVAVPALSVEAVGQVSTGFGQVLWTLAEQGSADGEAGANEPLPVSDELVYRGVSPAQAMADADSGRDASSGLER